MLTKDDIKQISTVIQSAVAPLDHRLERVEEDIKTIKTSIYNLDLKVEVVNKKIDRTAEDIGELISDVAGYHDRLEQRVTKLEKHTAINS